MKLSNIIPFKLYIWIALLSMAAPVYLYAENCPDNAVSYWKLDETSAFTYEDSIGNNNGSCAICPAAAPNDGAVNGSQSFDGSNSINVPAAAGFDWSATTSFSVEMWVKRTSATLHANGEVLIGRIDPASSLEWRVEIRDVAGQGHRAAFKLVDANGTGAAENLVTVGSKPITTDIWHHIVAIRDAATNTNVLYVDGQEDASQPDLQYTAGFGSAAANLNIGWIDGAVERPLNGLVDEVAVYNRTLTEQEIRAHYYLSKGYCDELDNAIRITPMGDSITKDRLGVDDDRPPAERAGYREALYDYLRGNNFWFDFIGSEGDKNDGVFEDIDHTAWGAIRTSHLLDMLGDGIFTSPDAGVGDINLQTGGPYLSDSRYSTDIILLHIGTNDVWSKINDPVGVSDFPATPMTNLADILNQIDSANERTTVLLARIIDREGDPANYTRSYNDALGDLAVSRNLAGDKIIVVDMERDADLNYVTDGTAPYTGGDLMDGVHPNPVGYPKLGNLWHQVLSTILTPFVAPNITSSPIPVATRNQMYTYPVISEGTGTLTYDFVGTQPQGMTITSSGVIEWTPTADGTFDVTVRVSNPMPFGQTGTDEQPITIVVTANAPPVAVADTYTANKGTTLNQSAAQGVLVNDTDADSGDTLTAVQLQAPTHGSLILNSDGSFTYVHDDSDPTTDTFTYAASDGKSQSSAVTVTLNIEGGVIEPNNGGGGGGGGGCFISATSISGSQGDGRELMMIGALAALGILVIRMPAVAQRRRNNIIGN